MRTRLVFSLLVLITAMVAVPHASAREWSSTNGHYKLDAEDVAFSDKMVVLKKPNGDLVAVELEELSKADQEYVREKREADVPADSVEEMQTWTTHDGLQVRARVLAFGRKQATVERILGKPHVNGTKFADLSALQQRVVLRTISELEGVSLSDERDFMKWVATNVGGKPKTYDLEGVLMELESGDRVGVPFFLFTPKERKLLEPGWEEWKAREGSLAAQEQESFLMRSTAEQYQQDREQQRQIQMLRLNLLATRAGIIDIWEVHLRPGPGRYGREIAIIVPATDSRTAEQIAVRQHPGYVLGPVRKLN